MALALLLALVVMMAGLLLLALQVRAFREWTLAAAIQRSQVVLPGRIAVDESSWPALGRLEFTGVRWTDSQRTPADSLAAAGSVVLELSVGALLHHDLVVREMIAEDLRLNVPAIQGRLAQQSNRKPRPPSTAGAQDSWFRDGSIAGTPSLRIERLHIAAPSVRLSDSLRVEGVVVDGALDISHDSVPHLVLNDLRGRVPEREWEISAGHLRIEPGNGRMEGRIEGRLGATEEVALLVDPLANDSLFVRLALDRRGPPPAGPGLQLNASFLRDGLRYEGLSFAGTLAVPFAGEIAGLPGLGRPDTGRLAARLTGALELGPPLGGELALETEPHAWLDEGRARIAYRDRTATLASLVVRANGLEARASGRVSPDSVSARADVRVTSPAWLVDWGFLDAPQARDARGQTRDSATLPDRLDGALSLDVRGPSERPGAHLDVAAAGRIGGFEFEHARVLGEIPPGWSGGGALSFAGRALGREVTLFARIDPEEKPLVVRLSPIDIHRAPATEARGLVSAGAANAGERATIRLPVNGGALEVENLRVTGDLGDFVVNGRLRGMEEGEARVEWRAMEVPGLLLEFLRGDLARAGASKVASSNKSLTPAQLDAFRSRWREQGPFTLTAQARLLPGSGAWGMTASGSFTLPGPLVLAPWLGWKGRVDDMRAILGRFRVDRPAREKSEMLAASANATGSSHAFLDGLVAEVDLGATPWIERGIARATGQGERIALQQLSLSLEDIDLEASGIVGAHWDARANLAVSGTRWLSRLSASPVDSMRIALRANARVTGAGPKPDVRVEWEGSYAQPGFSVPLARGWAQATPARVEARLDAPQGLRAGGLRFDRAIVRAVNPHPDAGVAQGRVSLLAAGPREAVRASADVAPMQNGGWEARADSLEIELGGHAISARQAFAVRFEENPARVSLEGLRMGGELGDLALDGAFGEDLLRLDLSADIVQPVAPGALAHLERFWPERIALSAHAESYSDLQASAMFTRIPWSGKQTIDARLDISEDGRDLLLQGNALAASDTVWLAHARMPGLASLDSVPASIPVSAVSRFLDLPLPLDLLGVRSSEGRAKSARVAGRVDLAGTLGAPSAVAGARVTFPDIVGLEEYRLDLAAAVHPREGLDPALEARSSEVSVPGAALPDSPEGGVRASFAVRNEEKLVAQGDLVHAFPWTLTGPAPAPDPARPIALRIDSQALALRDFQALLPPGFGIEGDAQMHLEMRGPVSDPALDGFLRAARLTVSFEDNTRISSGVDLRAGGSLLRPSLAGKIQVFNGAITVPEQPRELHPVEGHALLWEAHAAAAADSISVANGGNGSSNGAAVPPFDLDVTIEIPSRLWVRGSGLEIETAGTLRVTQHGAQPTIVGELRAVQGTFGFMGRTFQVERGSVVFYGEDEANPSLDVELAAQVGEVRVTVNMQGTLLEPQLTLTSDPPMEEGDILSYVVFGSALNQLSTGQLGLLQDRATDVAASFAAGQLQTALSRQLGVDLLTIRRAEGEARPGSVVIGKYLSPRILLTYEQSFQGSLGFFVNLEYLFTRHLRLETLLGYESRSAVEVSWSRDY
ncbi:MAG: translocation/assembly module TamB [Candidatus Eisenbacteria bacterium]|nr:translocation/assembly module TamB [Candidatus Eisenbacteria bacterium]